MKLPRLHITCLRDVNIQSITNTGYHNHPFVPALPTITEVHELLHSVLVGGNPLTVDFRDPYNNTPWSILYTLMTNPDGHLNNLYFKVTDFSVVERAATVFDMPLSCIGDRSAFEEYLQTLGSRVSTGEASTHTEVCIEVRNFILYMPLIIVLN